MREFAAKESKNDARRVVAALHSPDVRFLTVEDLRNIWVNVLNRAIFTDFDRELGHLQAETAYRGILRNWGFHVEHAPPVCQCPPQKDCIVS